MKRFLNQVVFAALALACALMAGPAMATFHTYQIFSIFSNADGTVQYIVLHEALGFNGQSAFHGHALTSSSGGNNQMYVFPNDLPGGCGPAPATDAERPAKLVATFGMLAPARLSALVPSVGSAA